MRIPLLLLALLPALAVAGGSNYTVAPGVSHPAGKITEWPVPTPKFARDPAPGPDGRIYIAVMHGNRLARFDPASQQFEEWELPPGTRPHGLVVDERGTVWMTGNGNGTLLEIPFVDGQPQPGGMKAHKTPSGGSPHTIIFDGRDTLWFTNQGADKVTRYQRSSGKMTEFDSRDGPYGLAMDRRGNVWFCQASGQRVGRIDAATGRVTEIDLGAGSLPRRIAAAPDDTLWVVRYGDGKLSHIDAATSRIIATHDMPAGPKGNPYAVTVDGEGKVWANEIATDTVTLFDPATQRFRVFPLPGKNEGIRKMIVDARGRLWYMGSHSGRLGMVE